ncbi:MAG: 16S rRNA (guanine(966)-N(2))-methyltransferase RsmD [Zetaproteobacteria bacterium]|nr:MAG: 16S rRNA (guanine(966)-N(2))-methyltransferase RsmD [Zetaproteobacteria bacterium]
MRITAGRLHGRRVRGGCGSGVRPTTARVREALFNILGPIEGGRVLDCFSGSGMIALEALSRGAASALSIERDRKAVARMEELRRAWGLERCWRILPGDVGRALTRLAGSRFTLIFADPPYRSAWPERLIPLLQRHRIRSEWLVIETAGASMPAWPAAVVDDEVRRYGESTLHFLRLAEE